MQRHYRLRPSRFLTLLLVILCVAPLVSSWSAQLPFPWLPVLAIVVLLWGGYYQLSHAALRKGHSCVAFRLEDDCGIVLVLRNGRHLSGRISPDSLVTPYFIIVNVMGNERGDGRSLLIMPDTMGAESFRRLRVVLRWGARADHLPA
jgi:toxin CptA